MVILHPGKCSLAGSTPQIASLHSNFYWAFKQQYDIGNKYLCHLPGFILSLWQTFSDCITSKPSIISPTPANASFSSLSSRTFSCVSLRPDSVLSTLFCLSYCLLHLSQCPMALPPTRQIQFKIKSLLPRVFLQRNLRSWMKVVNHSLLRDRILKCRLASENMGMTWIDSTVLLKGQKAPFSPPQAPEWLPLPWHWSGFRIPSNAASHSLAAKGKERLGQNTGAHTGSQTHLILAPHAAGWRLSLASSLLTPLHTPACPSVFSSTHYLHQRFDFHPPYPFFFFFPPQSDSNSWCIYLRWCGCCKMKYLQQPVCGWFEGRRVSTMSLKEGVRYKSCLQTARVHSRLQRHLFVWKVGWVFLPPFSFSWTWKRMKVAGCVHSFRLIMRMGLTGMVIWQPLHFL